MEKHAYLIIAHNQFDFLSLIINSLDYEYHDIYLLIDKKTDVDITKFSQSVSKSNLYIVPPIKIHWGSYSQIEAEMILLKEAIKKKYSYFHLISGSDFPVKENQEIYSYFEGSDNTEFLELIPVTKEVKERYQYFHYFLNNKILLFSILSKVLVRIQRLFRVDRSSFENYGKGANWFSITRSFAKFVVEQEENIKNSFKHTLCCDEVFMQTILINSSYNAKLCPQSLPFPNKRFTVWVANQPQSPQILTKHHYNDILKSDCLFARKFNENDSIGLLELFLNKKKGKNFPLVSIIVPVYNKAPYIEKCLQSISKQTYLSLECIIVNDGSVDKSDAIIRDYCKNEVRFRYFCKSNGGVSSARNFGITHAKGEYIIFLDADDFVKEGYIENLISPFFLDNQIILSICNVDIAENAEKKLLISDILSNFDDYYNYKIYNAPWGKCFKKNAIVECFNEKFFIGEDLLFIMNYLSRNKRKKVYFRKNDDYNYENNSDSITNEINIDKITQILDLINEIQKFNCQSEVYEIIKIQSKSMLLYIRDLYKINASLSIEALSIIVSSTVPHKLFCKQIKLLIFVYKKIGNRGVHMLIKSINVLSCIIRKGGLYEL